MKKIVPAYIYLSCLVLFLCFSSCKKNSSDGGSSQPPPPVSNGGGIMVTDTSAYIGVNYNESFQEINFGELSRSKTKWVRGFLDVFSHYDNNDLETSPRIIEYLKLKGQGYKTAVNLKFNFKTRSFPVINSSDWNKYISFIDNILNKIIDKTDVLIVGNEPFIESETSTWNEPLNSFYKAAAERVNQFLKTRNIQRPVFVGAFDNLYQSGRQGNAGIVNLLSWCKATPWVAGIDLHIHHSDNSEIMTALNFVDNKLRDDQKIIISEYSLMKWWRSNLDMDLASEFLAAANADANDRIYPPTTGITKVWQYVDYALKNPRPLEEWNAFQQHTPWLESRKDYMCSSFKLFRGFKKFWFSAYAMRQSYPQGADFTATTDPWVLNSLFTGRSVELLPDGEAQGRYGFQDQFADINTNNTTCN